MLRLRNVYKSTRTRKVISDALLRAVAASSKTSNHSRNGAKTLVFNLMKQSTVKYNWIWKSKEKNGKAKTEYSLQLNRK